VRRETRDAFWALSPFDYAQDRLRRRERRKICFPGLFSLALPAAGVYIPNGVDFPIFEPDVKAFRRARRLRDTDGDGVCPAGGRTEVRRVMCEE
jgi:hypothetical protein